MSHNKFTKEELDFIKQNAYKLSDKEISDYLGTHSECSIATKRKRMGLPHTNNKYTHKNVVDKMLDKGYELLSGEDEYQNCLSPMRYICPTHRDKGVQTISLGHLNEGKGCVYCGFEKTGESELVPEDRLKDLCKEKNIIYVGRKIKNGRTHIDYYCEKHLECGIQTAGYRNMLRPHTKGCIYCAKSNWSVYCSKGVQAIESILNILKIRYIKEYDGFKECKDLKPLAFDFYLPTLHACIEYDGKHHFQPITFGIHTKERAQENYILTQKRDNIKNFYCKENNIPLLRINYKQNDAITSIVYEWIRSIKAVA